MSPPARLGVVAEERAHLALLRFGQELQDGRPPLLVDLRDEVGGVVGRHGAEQLGRLGVGAGLHELDLVLGVELLEDVRLELAVLAHRLDDLLALLVRRLLDQVGDLGRMETAPACGTGCAAEPRARGRRTARCWPSRRWRRHRRCCPSRPGRRRRSTPRAVGSTPTTSQPPSIRASSISLARMSRAPTRLIRWRALRSWARRTSPGRRSKRRRSTRAPSKTTLAPDRWRRSCAPARRGRGRRSRRRARRPADAGCRRGGRSGPATRPRRSPLASTSGRFTMPERWISSGIAVA